MMRSILDLMIFHSDQLTKRPNSIFEDKDKIVDVGSSEAGF